MHIIDLDILIFICLNIILFLYKSKFYIKDKANNIYVKIIMITMIIIFLEILDKIILLNSNSYLVPITKLIDIVGFGLSPIVSYLWLLHVLEKLNIKVNFKFISIPIIINLILCVMTYKYGYIFTVNNYNEYERGPLFIVPLTIAYIYLLLSLYIIHKNEFRIDKKEYINLILFEMIPLLASIIQIIFSEILIIWSSVGISIILYYIYLQEKLLKYDNLTGAWNRLSFEMYVNNSLISKNIPFSVIYIDLDDFKHINDTYGHDEGDLALKNIVQFLKDYFRQKGIVIRMGGDEFVIIVHEEDKENLDNLIINMTLKLDEYNQGLNKEYNIKISLGYDTFNEKYNDLDTFIKSVDKLMYLNKNQNKVKG